MNYTGVLHMHSTHSYDGTLSLSELKAFLQKRGIQFACMTEHTDYLTPETAAAFVHECRALSDASFVFVPGFEVPYGRAHVLHFGVAEFICAIAGETELLEWRSVSPLVVLAHPVRNQFVVDEPLRHVLDGVEVWNQQYDGKQAPRVRSVALLQELRRKNQKLMATAGLDFHRVEHFGGPTITLSANQLDETHIMQALTTGAFTNQRGTFSFGATGALELSFGQRLRSHVSVGIIGAGKRCNKLLRQIGLRPPRFLVRLIRGRL